MKEFDFNKLNTYSSNEVKEFIETCLRKEEITNIDEKECELCDENYAFIIDITYETYIYRNFSGRVMPELYIGKNKDFYLNNQVLDFANFVLQETLDNEDISKERIYEFYGANSAYSVEVEYSLPKMNRVMSNEMIDDLYEIQKYFLEQEQISDDPKIKELLELADGLLDRLDPPS